MNRRSKLQACFKEADFDFDIRHFDHRLMAQKLVYLLEEIGVRIGYQRTFSFYLRGTYSPTLTKDLFGMQQEPPGSVELSKADKERIRKLMSAVELRPHRLEVMAAYRFLRNEDKSQDEALQTIKATKPFLSERDIALGISQCKGIYPEITEQDLKELEAEMAPWEAASAKDGT